MTADPHRLYNLLPGIYRLRDAERGEPLKALLSIIEEQLTVLEEALDQSYDDLFIETCADWIIPYIGELIGYRSLHDGPAGIPTRRAEIANTIAYRRRRSTPAMLERLARDVTGWPASIVEYFELLATTQFMNHPRPHNKSADLRHWQRLERLDTPFDSIPRTIDTRSIARREGKHNIPNIAAFLWRLQPHRLSSSQAVAVDALRFRFSPLGTDTPLMNRPRAVDAITGRTTPLNVPEFLSRRTVSESLADYYGDDLAFHIEGIDAAHIRICNLADDGATWAHTPPPAGVVAIDPLLGRIAFAQAPAEAPAVTFHTGFSSAIGGGEYERAATFALPASPADQILAPALIQPAIDARSPDRAIEITDDARYNETIEIALDPGEHVEIRAANEHRPSIVLDDRLVVSGGDAASELSLNGLLLIGAPIRISGQPGRISIRHCTLIPGLALNPDGSPTDPGNPSLIIETPGITVEIDHSILGAVRCHEASTVHAISSIIDANHPARPAFAGPADPAPGEMHPCGGTLRLDRTTVIGKLRAREFELVTNSILHARLAETDPWPAPILADRRQSGCIRFSYLPRDARVPRRFHCQPDLQIETDLRAAVRKLTPPAVSLTSAQRDAIARSTTARIKPSFTSLAFGDPTYAQLSARTPDQIIRGSDAAVSMGAFHDEYEPHRIDNLRLRLREYLRLGLEAGIFHAT